MIFGEIWESLAAPLGACMLLAGIHVYLGLHVLQRRVIFVDLALAQLTALGAVVGECFGYEIADGGVWTMVWSLGAGLIGAGIFASLGLRARRVPTEASVGIVYITAMALTVLLSTNLPHGTEHSRALLSGSILWVDGEVLLKAALLYAVVGGFHFLFRRRFLQVSFDREHARAEHVRVRLWDFAFYASFAVVVASSVALAGVLLVFAYLVMPAVIAVLFADSVQARLLIGWLIGGLVSGVGVVGSYYWDLPSGPSIVVALAVAVILAVGLRAWRRDA